MKNKYMLAVSRLRSYPLGVILNEFWLDIKNDLGFYKYKHPIIFIAGCNRGGSTWLQTMLAGIPGYNVRSTKFKKKFTNPYYYDGIEDEAFTLLPKNKYSVMRLHTKYSEENMRVIKKHVKKFIVVVRDPRDVCVSYWLTARERESHVLYQKSLSYFLDRFDPFVEWMKGWVSVKDDSMLFVQYENLNKDTVGELKRITRFFDISVPDKLLHKLADTKLKKEVTVKETLQKTWRGRLQTTARKGMVGDWKNYFTDEHEKKFKRFLAEQLYQENIVKEVVT